MNCSPQNKGECRNDVKTFLVHHVDLLVVFIATQPNELAGSEFKSHAKSNLTRRSVHFETRGRPVCPLICKVNGVIEVYIIRNRDEPTGQRTCKPPDIRWSSGIRINIDHLL